MSLVSSNRRPPHAIWLAYLSSPVSAGITTRPGIGPSLLVCAGEIGVHELVCIIMRSRASQADAEQASERDEREIGRGAIIPEYGETAR